MRRKTEINEDCFGYSELKTDCTVLKEFYVSLPYNSCRGCPFYKTAEEFMRDREDAERRNLGRGDRG